jgi:hypothetical protein
MQTSKLILSFLGKYWKQITIIVLLLVAIFAIKGCSEKSQRIKDLQAASKYNDSLYSSKIKDFTDNKGELEQQVDNLFVDHFALLDDLDSINNLLGVKPKQVLSFSKTATQLKVDVKPRVDTVYGNAPKDSNALAVIEKLGFEWFSKDSTTHVWGVIGNNEDSIHVNAIDTLSRVDYWKRKWFLGAKTYYTDFHNSNENIRIVGYKGVQFRQKEKRWNISFGGGFGYPFYNIQFNKPVPFIGVFAGYSLFRF